MPKRKISNHTHTSRTDPEASLAHKKGAPQKLKYKIHNCIDADSRIIIDTHVTSGKVHDSQVCLERLSFLKEERKYPLSQVIADRAYGSLDILLSLKEKRITTYIPLFSSRSGSQNERWENFTYYKQGDYFICPEGAILAGTDKHYNNLKAYFSKASDCQRCPQESSCQATKRSSHSRYIRRNIHQEFLEEVMKEMTQPIFAEKMRERRWKIEGLFAEAKNNHGLARAKYRGRGKVQIQAFMTAAIQNLKRVMRMIPDKEGIPPFIGFISRLSIHLSVKTLSLSIFSLEKTYPNQ